MTDQRFAGRIVMVTGGGSGLGKAAVERFSREGATVLVADIDVAAATAVAEAAGGTAIRLDISDAGSVEAAVRTAVETCGRLDVLVNNAGTPTARGPLHAATLENWRRTIAVNLEGVFLGMKFGLVQMLAQGGGAIVNVASTAAVVGLVEISAYGAAKAGVVNLTRTAAVEYGPYGIRVNAVAPTAVSTPLFRQMAGASEEAAAEIVAKINPLAGAVTAEDVAAAIAFLAGDDARAISGVLLPVDGAFTAR